MQTTLEALLDDEIAARALGDNKSQFDAGNEFIALANFVPEPLLRELQEALPRLDA